MKSACHAGSLACVMPDFDRFYLDSRKDLLLQTFALTGDLTASRAAVQDAFVLSRHHWRKVRLLEEPIQWVRPRAWSIAQRRSVGRIWHRVKGADDEQKAVLKALSGLPETQRKLLLLTQLTRTPPSHVGREVGLTLPRVAAEVEQATTSLTQALSCEPVELPARLHLLDPLLVRHRLPRASAIRRQGQLRRRKHVVAGALAGVSLTLASGWFVNATGTQQDRPRPAKPVTRSMLLTAAEVQATLTPAATWQEQATSDNTSGSGINASCQRARFADDRGLMTWVRRLASVQKPVRTAVQAVEVSESAGAAERAFQTASGWYAGCTEPGVQLSRAFDIRGIGDEARGYKLRVPAAPQGSYYVMIARAGQTLSTLTVQSNGKAPQKVQQVAALLGRSVDRLCKSDAAGDCAPSVPTVSPILPPVSGEGLGMLATADLPSVRGIDKGWVGTPVKTTTTNVARTICDNTDFTKAGATAQETRTFLIPQASVPTRFGLTETRADFATPQQARTTYAKVLKQLSTCEDRQLGSKVSLETQQPRGFQGSAFALWRVSTEINKFNAEVDYWMGVALVGSHVAQVNFTPSGTQDVSQDTFRDLMARARDRLFELPARSQ